MSPAYGGIRSSGLIFTYKVFYESKTVACVVFSIVVTLLVFCSAEKTDEIIMNIVDILVLSDRINKMHSCALNNMKLSSPDMKFPELHMEVYDGLP